MSDLEQVEGTIRRAGMWEQYETAMDGLGPRRADLAYMFLSGMSAYAGSIRHTIAEWRRVIETKGGRYPKNIWGVDEETST